MVFPLPRDCASSLKDKGQSCRFTSRPMADSLTPAASVSAEDPVTNIAVGSLSVSFMSTSRFNVSPISGMRCASSITRKRVRVRSAFVFEKLPQYRCLAGSACAVNHHGFGRRLPHEILCNCPLDVSHVKILQYDEDILRNFFHRIEDFLLRTASPSGIAPGHPVGLRHPKSHKTADKTHPKLCFPFCAI